MTDPTPPPREDSQRIGVGKATRRRRRVVLVTALVGVALVLAGFFGFIASERARVARQAGRLDVTITPRGPREGLAERFVFDVKAVTVVTLDYLLNDEDALALAGRFRLQALHGDSWVPFGTISHVPKTVDGAGNQMQPFLNVETRGATEFGADIVQLSWTTILDVGATAPRAVAIEGELPLLDGRTVPFRVEVDLPRAAAGAAPTRAVSPPPGD